MSKRTLFLIFALFLITGILLVLAIYKPQAPKVSQVPAVTPTEPIAQTILSFGNPTTATSSSLTNLNYSMPINVSTGKNKVTAIQLEMQYDPLLLNNVTMASGSFFTNPIELLKQIDTKTGRISYALGAGLQDTAAIGNGVVATLNFSIKATPIQKTAIIFLPKTLVTAEDINESVLKEANLIQITIGKESSTPSSSMK